MEQCETPKIEIVEYEISQPVSGQWKLGILWRFTNRTNGVLYVLVANPRPIVTEGQVVLDHSALDNAEALYFNVVPEFAFIVIPHAETAERWLPCNLELPCGFDTITIVGKFGYNCVPPDPDWERTRNWMQVAKWQQIASSYPVAVRPEKGLHSKKLENLVR